MSIVTFLDASSAWITILAIWTLAWKGIALWKASQAKEKAWFIVLLIVNTLGILEIIYLFIFIQEGRFELKNWRRLGRITKKTKSHEHTHAGGGEKKEEKK